LIKFPAKVIVIIIIIIITVFATLIFLIIVFTDVVTAFNTDIDLSKLKNEKTEYHIT